MKTRYFYTFLFLALASLLFYSCQDNASDPALEDYFEGQVVDENDEPLAYAVVEIYSDDTEIQDDFHVVDTTDAEGKFRLSGIPESLEGLQFKVSKGEKEIFKDLLKSLIQNNGRKGVKIKAKAQNDDCCGVVNVLVKDENGDPIEDAEVRLNQGEKKIAKKFTDSDGKTSFENVCEGSYWFRIAKEGYKVIEEEFEIGECDTLDQEYEMIATEEDSCCDGILKIYPKDSESGEKITNAYIKLWQDGKLIEKAQVNESGVAIIDNICEGKYGVDLIAEGYENIEFEVEFDCDEVKEIEKKLTKSDEDCCDGIVFVVVKDSETEERLGGVKVRLWKGSEKIAEVKTNENGVAKFEDVCKGGYQISILAEGYEGYEFNFEIGCDEEKEFHKTITKKEDSCCDGILKIYPKDSESGEKITNAYIKLWQDGKLIEKAQVNESGVAIIDNICEGKYGVDLIAEGYENIEFEVEFDCDEVKEIEKKLVAEEDQCCTAVLKLNIIDKETEEAIEGAVVILKKNGKAIEDPRSDSEGKVEIDGICAPQKYVVVIEKEGYKRVEFELEYKKCYTKTETVKLRED